MYDTFFKWTWVYYLLFANLASCDPKNDFKEKKAPQFKTIAIEDTSVVLFDFIEKHEKIPDYILQNGDRDNPKLFALPNRKQMDLLIMRLTRTGDSRRRLLQMKSAAVPYLCVALLSPERFSLADIRQECAILLGEIKDPISIKSLLISMKTDEDIITQITCVNALAKFHSQEAIKPMRELFLSKGVSTFLKSALAIALADIGDREIVPYLKTWTETAPSEQCPYKSSKKRYLYWHLKEALKILTGERNTYSSPSFITPGIFSHKDKNDPKNDQKK